MLGISDTYKNKIINELIDNKLEIFFPDGDGVAITEDNIVSESMKLKQSACDESKLKFGGCIAAQFEIDLINTETRSFASDLEGKWISVRLTHIFPNGMLLYPSANIYPGRYYPGEITAEQSFYLFSGYIDSAKVDRSNKNIRHIVAYDMMAKINELDATSLIYGKINTGELTIGSIFSIIFSHYNIPYNQYGINTFFQTSIGDVNGTIVANIPAKNTDWYSDNSLLTAGEAIKSICEMLGLFGQIIPTESKGYFDMFSLLNKTKAEKYEFNEKFYSEEYMSNGYTAVQVTQGSESRSGKSTVFYFSFTPDNISDKIYDMSDNIFAWQEGLAEGANPSTYISNLYNNAAGKRFYNSNFTPFTARVDGRPWVEVGDKIAIVTYKTDVDGDYVYDETGNPLKETFNSYVLSRTLSGIKALKDDFETKGEI